jgi:hypothetical protein
MRKIKGRSLLSQPFVRAFQGSSVNVPPPSLNASSSAREYSERRSCIVWLVPGYEERGKRRAWFSLVFLAGGKAGHAVVTRPTHVNLPRVGFAEEATPMTE